MNHENIIRTFKMGRITFSLNCLEIVILSVTWTSSGREMDEGCQ